MRYELESVLAAPVPAEMSAQCRLPALHSHSPSHSGLLIPGEGKGLVLRAVGERPVHAAGGGQCGVVPLLPQRGPRAG